jgi:hypothetical protein
MSVGCAAGAFAPEWLELREGADAAARATELVDLLVPGLPRPPLIIHDLGCGTGAMGRWLAPRLPAPQRWILRDRDPALLLRAAVGLPGTIGDRGWVTVTLEQGDITGLRPADLAGASLVTASALLDLLTAGEVADLAAACVAAGCPALLTLSVSGQVRFSPADPLDTELAAAFDDHQRRTSGGRSLLGPEAAGVAATAFERAGAVVHRRASPWRLGPDQAELTAQWLQGWVAAAVEWRPDLAATADAYLCRRLAACTAGELHVAVGHEDLLALPSRSLPGGRASRETDG